MLDIHSLYKCVTEKGKTELHTVGVNRLISSKNWLEVLMLLRQLNMAVWEYVEYCLLICLVPNMYCSEQLLPIQFTYMTKAKIQVVEQAGIKTKDCPMKESDPKMFKGDNSWIKPYKAVKYVDFLLTKGWTCTQWKDKDKEKKTDLNTQGGKMNKMQVKPIRMEQIITLGGTGNKRGRGELSNDGK